MSEQTALTLFQKELEESVQAHKFLKLSLGNYKGTENELKNIYVRPVLIKRLDMMSFTYRYKTRDIVKNLNIQEGLALILTYLNSDFHIATLFMADEDLIIQQHPDGSFRLKRTAPALKVADSLQHDKSKARKVESAEKKYLQELKITDAQGNVFKNAQDKFKQINQYIEILSPMLKSLPDGELSHVVDMGSGKGYLTFALYDYLHAVLKLNVDVTGVEYREDLVLLCNRIALDSGFEKLKFVQGTIEDYKATEIDLLIALHACDTATDDAIAKGIHANARSIVVAPCCHKQIRKEMAKGKADHALDFLLQHGIYMEKQAVMITDGIRALIMEYYGYKTKIVEFVSEANTPKNIMLIGTKFEISKNRQEGILKKINDTKAYFGIGYHHLERLMGL